MTDRPIPPAGGLYLLGLKIKEGRLVGKHNGLRVVGIEFGIRFSWNKWYWRPIKPSFAGCFLWLFFRINWDWEYEFK